MDNMMTSEQILLSSINMANLAVNMPESLKLDILQKYETLAQAKAVNNNSIVNDNMFNFQVLMNKTLFLTLVQTRKPVDLAQYTNLNNMLQLAIKDCGGNRSISAFNKLYTELSKDITTNGGVINLTPSAEDVQTAIQTFGVEHVEDEGNLDNIEDIDNIDTDISDDDLLGVDTDELFDVDDPELEDSDISVGDESAFAEDDTEEVYVEIENENSEVEKLTDEEKEEKRKEELKAGKVSGTANDIEKDNEADIEIQSLVNNAVNNIMSAYSNLYRPLFNNPPKGVLYTDESGKLNIMRVGNSENNAGVRVHGIPSIRLFVAPIYSAIKSASGQLLREAPKVGDDGMDIKASWMHSDGTMEYNYAPHIQVRNCMGVYKDRKTGKLSRAKNWSEFKEKLSGELKPTITALLKKVDLNDDVVIKRAMNSIQELYTSIILVNEFDVEKAFRLTICQQSLSNNGILDKLTDVIVKSNPLNKDLSNYKIMNCSTEGGVLQTLVVTDVDKYRGEINFAYKTLGKILTSGGNIDISHTIVGTDLSGEPVEVNLDNNAYVSIGIVAGSRSGKGVLTMSILASMIAAKCPVVYLDYKPDMAGTFWKLERKYGVKTLAIDGQTSKLGGLTPVRNYQAGYGIPSALKDEISDKLNVIPYIKGVQIMNLIGAARVAGKMSKNRKMFFVLDEAQQCSKQIADNTKSIITLRDKNKPKGKAEETEEYKYLVKLSKLFESVEQSASTFLNTNAGLGNMGALVLGQQANAQDWRGPLGVLMLKCAIKFLGNGTVGGSQYGLNNKIKGVGMIGTGYFGLSTSNTPTEDNTKIIKTTLVLNDADFNVETKQGGEYTGALLKNITNENIKTSIIEDDMLVSPNNDIALSNGLQIGEANPLVGFPGLIEFIGKNSGDFNIQEALGAGYNEVEKVLNLLGIVGEGCPYQNVEAYMYSAREDSIFTSGQLTNALNSGVTIYDYISNGSQDSEDGLIPDETDNSRTEDEILNMGASSLLNEEDENIDFGNEDAVTKQISDEEAFADFGGQVQREQKQVEVLPNFSKTTALMSKNYSDEILMKYFNKFRLQNRLMINSYNYSDRSLQTNKNGLALAVIVIGNYVYITEKLGLGQYTVIGNAYDSINSGKNQGYNYSFLLGIIDSLKDGSLQYDKMPTIEQMKIWAKKYVPVSLNNNQAQNPIDTSTVQNEQITSSTEDLGVRILRLSQEISLNRGWTAKQLIDFQNQVFKKLGVN